MTPVIEINVTKQAEDSLQRLAAEVSAPELREAIGLAGVEEVKGYYTRLDAERPNELGGKRTHFYAQAAESARWLDQGRDGVLLDVPEPLGLRQRILGGPIVPGQGKTYLTIPAAAEAYGKRAGEFNNLVPMFRFVEGIPRMIALAEAKSQTVNFKRKRKDGTVSRGKVSDGKVMFWLVKAVNQQPDSSAAPDDQAVKTAAIKGAAKFFDGLKGEVRT